MGALVKVTVDVRVLKEVEFRTVLELLEENMAGAVGGSSGAAGLLAGGL